MGSGHKESDEDGKNLETQHWVEWEWIREV